MMVETGVRAVVVIVMVVMMMPVVAAVVIRDRHRVLVELLGGIVAVGMDVRKVTAGVAMRHHADLGDRHGGGEAGRQETCESSSRVLQHRTHDAGPVPAVSSEYESRAPAGCTVTAGRADAAAGLADHLLAMARCGSSVIVVVMLVVVVVVRMRDAVVRVLVAVLGARRNAGVRVAVVLVVVGVLVAVRHRAVRVLVLMRSHEALLRSWQRGSIDAAG
jgi:hypothetical protein